MNRGWLIVPVGMAYAARPWSCARVLSAFGPMDDVPYANFDRHGIGSMTGLLLAFLFAVPVWRICAAILRPPAASAITPRRMSTRSRLIQPIVWLALAAPTYAQIDYLLELPATLTWPIVVSALAWMIVTACLWWLAARRADAAELLPEIGPSAMLIAGLTAVPKLLALGSASAVTA